MMSLSNPRMKILIIVILSLIALWWSATLAHWLSPAPSDVRLSYAQTSPVENARLPREALDNHMPQLGMLPFWIDGKLMQTLGPVAPYLTRYGLFLLALVAFYLLFLRIIRPASEDPLEWTTVFFLTVSGTFLFSIKFFFWLDYLIVLPLAFLSVALIRRSPPGWVLFLLTLFVLYVKMSGFYILVTVWAIFLTPGELRKYAKPIGIALFLSVGVFFLRWGFSTLADRGHSGLQMFPEYALMGVILLMKPWEILGFFDKAHQHIITDTGFFFFFKLGFILFLLLILIRRKEPHLFYRLGCLAGVFLCALLLIRDHPTLHDFAAYNGVIELGLTSLVWLSYRAFQGRSRQFLLLGLSLLFTLEMTSWVRAYDELGPQISRLSLLSRIRNHLGKNHSLYLFCSWNVGEFEYYLPAEKIHYSLGNSPVAADDLKAHLPALLLLPKGCLHEKVTEEMHEKYARLVEEHSLRHLATLPVERNQAYELFEAP